MPWPQGRSADPQAGQPSRPPIRSVSTAASSVPTMSTAELRLRQEEPLRDPSKRFSEGALPRSGRAHADASALLRKPGPAQPVLIEGGAANRAPNRAQVRWRRTAQMLNERGAQQTLEPASTSIVAPRKASPRRRQCDASSATSLERCYGLLPHDN